MGQLVLDRRRGHGGGDVPLQVATLCAGREKDRKRPASLPLHPLGRVDRLSQPLAHAWMSRRTMSRSGFRHGLAEMPDVAAECSGGVWGPEPAEPQLDHLVVGYALNRSPAGRIVGDHGGHFRYHNTESGNLSYRLSPPAWSTPVTRVIIAERPLLRRHLVNRGRERLDEAGEFRVRRDAVVDPPNGVQHGRMMPVAELPPDRRGRIARAVLDRGDAPARADQLYIRDSPRSQRSGRRGGAKDVVKRDPQPDAMAAIEGRVIVGRAVHMWIYDALRGLGIQTLLAG